MMFKTPPETTGRCKTLSGGSGKVSDATLMPNIMPAIETTADIPLMPEPNA
jgi:hypothetical protein